VAERAVIGYCRAKDVAGEFCESLVALAMEGKTQLDALLALKWGPNISTARNKIVDDFLTLQRAPWLLMVDTDMVFAGDALDRLIAVADPHDRPIVGALCYSQDGDAAQPVMYELGENAAGTVAFVRYTTWPQGGLQRVSATGAAFLLMHRGALEKIQANTNDTAAPWFRETAVAPLALMGEDLTFCLRAGAAGIPIHVHTGVQVGHMKTGMLGKVG